MKLTINIILITANILPNVKRPPYTSNMISASGIYLIKVSNTEAITTIAKMNITIYRV